jgi:hypothetical protein
MSNSLAEYLSALEARDAREQAHQVYLEACEYHQRPWALRANKPGGS